MQPDHFVAPLGGHEGCSTPRPWQHAVTVAIPHLETLAPLRLAVELWRHQKVKPYLCVIDTGSPVEVCDELEAMRAADLEIHYVRAHGYRHPSAPVGVALDLAQAVCRTEYLLHTHSDLFPRSRDLLAWQGRQCGPQAPVVGWRMSPRETSTAPDRGEWRDSVSHTCTMLYMPAVWRHGLNWSLEGYYAQRPAEDGEFADWPDTESGFYLSLRRAGITPVLLGDELNNSRQVTDWWDHARSFTVRKTVAAGGELAANLLWALAQENMRLAEASAWQRLAAWSTSAQQEKEQQTHGGELQQNQNQD